MIHKFTVKKLDNGLYCIQDYALYSPEASRKMADSLFLDWMWREASWYDARAREGTQFILESSVTSHTPGYELPPKARRKLDRDKVRKGKKVSITVCLY